MAQPAKTPAHSVLEEHRAIHGLLAEIEVALGPPSSRSASGDEAAAARLGALRGLLSDHFKTEEEAGLFEQIEELAPELVHECERLCNEHESLLQRLDTLCAAGPEARREPAWGDGVRVFLNRLSEHEARENEVLNRALDGSVEAQD